MKYEIVVPPLSQTMDTLVFLEWLKHPGDPIQKGETLFRVETDKAALEVESPASGYLVETLAEPGSEIKIRSIIGTISTETSSISYQEIYTGSNSEPLPPERLNRIFASPRARTLASKEGIDLTKVKSSGPDSMIIEHDVIAYLEVQKRTPRLTPVAKRVAESSGLNIEDIKKQAAPAQVIKRVDVESILNESNSAQIPSDLNVSIKGITPTKLSPTRKVIATRMMNSHLTTAPFTVTRETDATELVALRENILKEVSEKDPRPSYTDFLIMIVSRCLQEYPQLNATFDGETLDLHENVNLSLAVDTERGLLTPVLDSIQGKRLLQIAHNRQEMVRRTLEGNITPEEMNGGTFTLSNLGSIGIDVFTPILNIPQVAILGVGRIHTVPAIYQNSVTTRQVMSLSLTVDHRVIDGGPAARFLMAVVNRIEKPHLSWI